jgi:hypothetical protein
MKRLIALMMLAAFLTVSGCAGTGAVTGGNTSITVLSESQVDAAQKTLLAAGAVLKSAPATLDTLYMAGKLTKDEYNQAATIYNQALAGWNLAVSYLKAGASSSTYLQAFEGFLTSQAELNIFLSRILGGQ